MKILVLGITGMLGSAVFRHFTNDGRYETFGTLRNSTAREWFPASTHKQLISNIDVLDQDTLIRLFEKVRPDRVINCVGLIKQLADAKNPLVALPVNSMLPHRLETLCALSGAQLIHISTDCVFSGRKGMYLESDISDAEDLYGKSKFIGELTDSAHAVTLRTSIIGHELNSNHALIDWFLSQSGSVKGYTQAIFSGLPTVELARVIGDFVIPRPAMRGLYHVSVQPIDKYSLLRLVAEIYGKDITIVPDDALKIDRSLASQRFRDETGYQPPSWHELVSQMYRLR